MKLIKHFITESTINKNSLRIAGTFFSEGKGGGLAMASGGPGFYNRFSTMIFQDFFLAVNDEIDVNYKFKALCIT